MSRLDGKILLQRDYLPTFGDRLRDARERVRFRTGKRMRQEDLGALVGQSKSTVSAWENGATPPSVDVVARLAEILGVLPGWLAFGDGPRYPGESAGSRAHGEAAT